MSIFRRKTIFHVEDALPDPEEIKLRFRRRVLLLTFVGFIAVLSIPVARDLKGDLLARNQARIFGERILETRKLASIGRVPVSLELGDDSRSWRRVFHEKENQCSAPVAGPSETWPSEIAWKLQVRKANGESFSGRNLCLHPSQGLLLDMIPISDGQLLITALKNSGQDASAESAYLLLSQFGADIQMVSHWDY